MDCVAWRAAAAAAPCLFIACVILCGAIAEVSVHLLPPARGAPAGERGSAPLAGGGGAGCGRRWPRWSVRARARPGATRACQGCSAARSMCSPAKLAGRTWAVQSPAPGHCGPTGGGASQPSARGKRPMQARQSYLSSTRFFLHHLPVFEIRPITTVDSPQTLPLSLHSPRRHHHRPPAPHARGPRLPLPLRPTSPTRSIHPPVCAACLPLPACALLACLPLLACALRRCSSSPALQATLPPPLTRCCTAAAAACALLHRRAGTCAASNHSPEKKLGRWPFNISNLIFQHFVHLISTFSSVQFQHFIIKC